MTLRLAAPLWERGLGAKVDWTYVLRDERVQFSGEMALLMAAAEGATWSQHIEPIYLDACATCHGGAADTVLESRQDWIDNIDPILDNVISGTMPLVGGAPH